MLLILGAVAVLTGTGHLAVATPSATTEERLESAARLEAEGKPEEAIDILVDLLAIADDTDSSFRAKVGANLARLYLNLGEYAEAMKVATTAAADAELANDRSAQAYAEFIVGMVHRDLNQLEAARGAFRASARLALDAGNSDQYLRSANEESNVLVLGGDLEGAVEHKLTALRQLGENADPSILISLENDIAYVYAELGRHADALPHLERAWKLSIEEDHHRQAAIIACNLAGNLSVISELNGAIAWAEKGLAIAESNELIPVQELSHAILGDVLFKAGEAARAVPHLQEAYELRGRILNESSAQRIAELGTRHEAERREAEIELLRRDAEIRALELAQTQSQRRMLVGGIAALAAFFAVLTIAYRLKVRANAEIRAANRNLETAHRRVEELSRTDALTGVANRRALDERLANEVLRSERSKNPFTVILADIDHFKRINDSFGHNVGDEVLRELSKRLRATVRGLDMVGRWGGEEFLIVLPDTDAAGGREVAKKLRSVIGGQPVTLAERSLTVTMTFGVATHWKGSIEDTIQRADEALYRGKYDGRDQVVIG
jgi:diguanylate cyclase (GGDEF)-like protein